ncbi:MAG: hypothetical protein JWP00_3043 [Chloroflexi bacterium]|nr:hypothetical protein [Chloroflexota bacterium]
MSPAVIKILPLESAFIMADLPYPTSDGPLAGFTPPGPAPKWPPPSTAIDFPAFEQMLKTNPTVQDMRQSVVWRVNGEIIMVLGWGRAILMQIAHPKVGAGVSQHSHFSSSPAAKLRRFKTTLDRMLTMTYGTPRAAWEAAHAIDTIHDRINGQDASQQRYSARDPELLKWVHATFADSMFKTYEMFVGPLSRQEKDQYLKQTSFVAPLLGAPPGYFPENLAELDAYMAEMLNSGTLKVGPQSAGLAAYVLEKLPVPLLGRALQWYARLLVGGMLPPVLRQAYGFKIGKADERILGATAWVYRHLLHPVLPPMWRRWKIARRALKQAKA